MGNQFIKNQTKMSGGKTNSSQEDTSSIHLGGVIKNGGGISIGGSLGNQGTKFDDDSNATGPQTCVNVDLKGMPMMLINLDEDKGDLLNLLELDSDSDDENHLMFLAVEDQSDDEESDKEDLIRDDEDGDLMNLRRKKSKKAKKSHKKKRSSSVKKGKKAPKKKSSGFDTEKEAWGSYDKAMQKIYAKEAKKSKKSHLL